jgi:hypothetical protein
VTINRYGESVVLRWPNGKPLLAGEIMAGERVTFNPHTGVIRKIGHKEYR